MTKPTRAAAGGKEQERIDEIRDDLSPWRRWGPYLTDRAWGTVREDYSADGNAWAHLPYEKARSKTYRWGEDGIAGICDRYQLLCFAPAFWNGRDSHLKERLFGVNPDEGNHGEDVKEYYFHVDNTPTHSYMSLLYKYPQAAFPYQQLDRGEPAARGQGPEYELIDTGVFDEDRYFDISIEYAKAGAEDLVIRISITTAARRPRRSTSCRTCGSATRGRGARSRRARRASRSARVTACVIVADDADVATDPIIPVQYRLGTRFLYGPEGGESLFTDNETNGEAVLRARQREPQRVHQGRVPSLPGRGQQVGAPARALRDEGGAPLRLDVTAGATTVLRFRLTNEARPDPLGDVDAIFAAAEGRGRHVLRERLRPRARAPTRSTCSAARSRGSCGRSRATSSTSRRWLDGDNPDDPPPQSRRRIRNAHWRHLNSMRVMTMPDKWEYPWFAAWDLAFQCVPFALVDRAVREGAALAAAVRAVPASRRASCPRTSGSSAISIRRCMPGRCGASTTWTHGATARTTATWLERCFHKLLINFASWVNKVDRDGNNVFEGGFLGLDNITVIDRSERSHDGSTLEQSDATGWMGMFCLNLMRIALELARENPVYEGMATRSSSSTTSYVAYAMKHMGGTRLLPVRPEGRLLLRRASISGRQVREVPRALARRV